MVFNIKWPFIIGSLLALAIIPYVSALITLEINTETTPGESTSFSITELYNTTQCFTQTCEFTANVGDNVVIMSRIIENGSTAYRNLTLKLNTSVIDYIWLDQNAVLTHIGVPFYYSFTATENAYYVNITSSQAASRLQWPNHLIMKYRNRTIMVGGG